PRRRSRRVSPIAPSRRRAQPAASSSRPRPDHRDAGRDRRRVPRAPASSREPGPCLSRRRPHRSRRHRRQDLSEHLQRGAARRAHDPRGPPSETERRRTAPTRGIAVRFQVYYALISGVHFNASFSKSRTTWVQSPFQKGPCMLTTILVLLIVLWLLGMV